MLLRFSAENHLSMRGRQELSLIASSLQDHKDGLIDCDAVPGGSVLPAVVIYGANASGKSNLVSAISFMRAAVLLSHSKGKPGEGVPRRPFALDTACKKASSTFDIDFVIDGIRYHYGFEATNESFVGEWLFHYPSGRRQLLFERNRKNFKFGRALKGQNRVISELTRDNSLFLSAAFQNGHEQLSLVAEFFQSIDSDTVISVGSEVAVHFRENDIDRRVINFLERIGTGVVDGRRTEKVLNDRERVLRNELFSALQKMSSGRIELSIPEKDVTIELAHRGNKGEPVYFKLGDESAGTRRLLLLLGELFKALDRGSLVLVDELDASLHTQACEALLALFSSRATNPKGAQLIATTHDTNLLRCPLLRRDQVWFTEKDSAGATHLYPLTDIRTRKDDNIEKGYLQGRYGAIPFSGPFSESIHVD